jgi:hypothetical protein
MEVVVSLIYPNMSLVLAGVSDATGWKLLCVMVMAGILVAVT